MTAAGQALRRRIVLAVILLAAFIVLLRVAVLAGEFDTVSTAATFEAARENRTALRAFLHRMPKGGDLPHPPRRRRLRRALHRLGRAARALRRPPKGRGGETAVR